MAASETARDVSHTLATMPAKLKEAGQRKETGDLPTLARWAAKTAGAATGVMGVGTVGRTMTRYTSAKRQKIASIASEAKKEYADDYKALAADISSRNLVLDWDQAMGRLKALVEMKGSKGLKELPQPVLDKILSQMEKSSPNLISDIAPYAVEQLKTDDDGVPITKSGKIIRKKLLEGKEKEIEELTKAGTDLAEAQVRVAFDEVVSSLKSKDIDGLGEDILTDPHFQESFIFGTPKHLLVKVLEEKGPDVTNSFAEKILSMDAQKIITENPRLASQFAHSPELRALIGPENLPEILRDKEKYKEYRSPEGAEQTVATAEEARRMSEEELEERQKMAEKARSTYGGPGVKKDDSSAKSPDAQPGVYGGPGTSPPDTEDTEENTESALPGEE